jgi:hypothetical protein
MIDQLGFREAMSRLVGALTVITTNGSLLRPLSEFL